MTLEFIGSPEIGQGEDQLHAAKYKSFEVLNQTHANDRNGMWQVVEKNTQDSLVMRAGNQYDQSTYVFIDNVPNTGLLLRFNTVAPIGEEVLRTVDTSFLLGGSTSDSVMFRSVEDTPVTFIHRIMKPRHDALRDAQILKVKGSLLDEKSMEMLHDGLDTLVQEIKPALPKQQKAARRILGIFTRHAG